MITHDAAADRDAADLAVAVAAAERAGELIMDLYGRIEHVRHKSARDVVTEADHLAEEFIIRTLLDHEPGDGIVAEESGEMIRAGDPGVDAPPPPSMGVGRTWIIDPLDGTVNYANGIPIFCVSIALAVDGHPRVGVVHDPCRSETFAAIAGQRPTLNGDPIHATRKESLSDFVVSLGISSTSGTTKAQGLIERTRVARAFGSSALSLAYIANGRFDAFIQQRGLSIWDVAAAGLIAECAGARVTNGEGGPWFELRGSTRSLGIVASSAGHHGEILGLLTHDGIDPQT